MFPNSNFSFAVADSKNNSCSSSEPPQFYNYSTNDIYCMNANPQQSNQFLSYQNYHHEQLMHHQYFDEGHHVQNYNFIPYASNEAFAAMSTPTMEQVHQENFPAIQSNELYEFLPEEIFQLDQPIVKSESQAFISQGNLPIANIDALHLPFSNSNGDISSTSHSFLDLSSGQIQTNVKYPTSVDGFPSSEINNNSNYQSSVGIETTQQAQSKVSDVDVYNYHVTHPSESRLNCAVESEKALKRKHVDIDAVSKLNPPPPHQNYQQLSQPLFSKRESSCLLQQTSNYYSPDLYTSFPPKSNDVYRTVEKYNYITNN